MRNTKLVASLFVLILLVGMGSFALGHSAYASSKTSDGKIKHHVSDKTLNYEKAKAIAKASGETMLAQIKKQHAR